SYLPAAVALGLRGLLPQTAAIFDCRGLLGDEYVDAGHWTTRDHRYRTLKRVERRLFKGSDGVIVLTDKIDKWLSDSNMYGASTQRRVIPCCVDLDRFQFQTSERTKRREALGIPKDAPVIVYAGTLGSWYRE